MKKGLNIACVFLMAGLCFAGCREQGEHLPLEQVLKQQDESRQGLYPESEDSPQTGASDSVWVHICGEVAAPGVYEMEPGSRIYDVLLAAGGFTREADQEAVNLAGEISDGLQIVIPSAAETAGRENGGDSGLVNINTASKEELCTLPGIGESRAADIISYRETNGPFLTREDIMKVSGIKTSVYEKIKDSITAGK